MHVCYNVNDSYIEPLLVSILSIVKLTRKKVTFHIISYGGITYDDFNQLSNRYNADFIIYDANKEMLSMKSSGRFPPVTYGRLFISKLISEKKVIYMDVDTVIVDDLHKLWDLDVSVISVVYEKNSKIARKQKEKLNLDHYFNSGVMLINVNEAKRYFEDAILLAKKNNYEYLDQDALNVAFKGVSFPLEEKYNYMNVNRTKVTPIVIHFAHLKPWKKFCLHSMKHEYTDLKKEIEYRHKMTEKSSIKELLKNFYLKAFQ
ncbi:glycosyltransferase family 8 protein [Photobacterium leiognathi]|uniref:glycosyltransferase family 8 protein n=1 Tax=Photobacterium leiognathi TaxID=553611 RepID=UPI002980B193|nr:glycosyltransferase [Photobacterium leiognathi]